MSIDEESEMMKLLDIRDVGELFADVPEGIKGKIIQIPKGISEDELIEEAYSISRMNRDKEYYNFLGNGIYDRIIPSSVDAIVSRSEFETSHMRLVAHRQWQQYCLLFFPGYHQDLCIQFCDLKNISKT